MQQIVFQFLGPPEISYKGQSIKIPRRRSRALLYYLVSTQSPQPRERLLPLLCGDVDEESARNTFKTLLAEVRSLLRGFEPGIDWIINDGDLLRLNPHAPLWLDTEIFEKMTAGTSRNLNQAIDLYRGAFLDGFFLKDAPDFDAWVRSARDHFHRLYIKALRTLAEAYESEDQFEQAIRCIQMLLATDPLMEEAYAHLMRLYWMTGNRIEALRQYEHLCAVLAQELAVKPSPSTQALYEQIARQGVPSSISPSPSPPLARREQENASHFQPISLPHHLSTAAPPSLVGRTAEVEWLRFHLSSLQDRYSLLLLQGSMGIGKTRILQEIRSVLDSSWSIFQGTCQEVEQGHPYHALVEALRQGLAGQDLSQINLPGTWLAQLALLLPDCFPFISASREYGIIEPLILVNAVVALLNGIARPQHPLLLVLDDLHWADAATLALLGHLAVHVRRGSVFLVGTYCQTLAGERLEPLRRSASRQGIFAELTLLPLSAADIRRLISSSFAGTRLASLPVGEQETLLNWCCQRSEGNPYFASAWLSLALERQELSTLFSNSSIPAPIEALVKQQLTQISPQALSLLTAGAHLGPSFDLLTAARFLQLSESAMIMAIDEIFQKSILVEGSTTRQGDLTFAHEIVRDVLLAHASPVYRHRLQRAAQES